MYTSINEFNQALSEIQWFSKVGQDTDYPHRIRDWYDWKGPESLEGGLIGNWYQELYDSFFPEGQEDEQLKKIWNGVQKETLAKAKRSISLPTDGDAWDAPTAASWEVSWVAALVAVHTEKKRPWPKDLYTVWSWHQQGRWPCEYVIENQEDEDLFSQLYSSGSGETTLIELFEKRPNKFRIF